MESKLTADVVVLGAGMAGLSAARQLAEAGSRVILLEARDRVGGRVYTVRTPGSDLPVELGAEFVHGRPPELLALIREAGLTLFEREGEFFCYENGRLCDCTFEDAFSVLDELPTDPDMSFSELLAEKKLPEHTAARVKGYVEGFNAADADLIGTAALVKQQHAEEAIEGDRSYRIQEGYDRLPAYVLDRFLSARGSLYLNTAARSVHWKPGEVRVRTSNPDMPEIRASKAVIALPLGVLQKGSVPILPAPPNAIHKLAMGAATRITLVFREQFWRTAAPDLSFLFTQDETPPTWWTSAPDPSPSITGWIAGPRTVHSPPGEALKDQALAVLSKAFQRTDLPALLLSFHTHDWQADPCSLGAYSYAPKGALLASDELAVPVEDTLYFAGEHTDITGHWGTVHGALRSGLRAAAQIME